MEKSRQIRVFISSTFRDMNAERDYLVQFVFPRIKEYCRKRYIDFVPIDLRWGIPEEESRNGWVLNTCFNEIDNSRPFFIGLVGNRYGWIPNDDDVLTLLTHHENDERFILDMADRGASVTEMEIEYAAFHDKGLTNALFFIRDDASKPYDADDQDLVKLEKLKHKIRSQHKYPVYDYSHPSEIGTIVEDAIVKLIEVEFPPEVNDLEQAILSRHEHSLSAKTRDALDTNSHHFLTWINENKDQEYDVVMVEGPAGSGISTTLAMGVEFLRKKFTSPILYFDFECVDASVRPIDALMEFLNLPGHQPSEDVWMMLALDNTYILSAEDVRDLTSWIRTTPGSLHFAIAGTYKTPAHAMLSYAFSPDSIKIHGFTRDMRREYARRVLAKYGKKLTDEQLDRIADNNGLMSAVECKLFIESMAQFGSFEDLDKRMTQLLDGTDNSLFWILITEANKLFASINMADVLFKALLAIAACADGLSEAELLTITGLEQSQWSIVRPFVLQFCKGDFGRLRFINYNWYSDFKQIYSPSIIASEGLAMLERVLDSYPPAEAALLLADICCYIRYLPFDKEQEQSRYHNISLTLLNSPDTSLALPFHIFSLLYNSYDFVEGRTNSVIGQSLSEVGLEHQVMYWHKVAKSASAANQGILESMALTNISALYNANNDHSRSTYFEARAFLAVGQADKARRRLLSIIADTDRHSEIYIISVLALGTCYDLEGDIHNSIESVFNNLPELTDEERQKYMPDLANTVIYIAYMATMYGQFDAAIEWLNDFKGLHEYLHLNDPAAYTFYLARARICEAQGKYEDMRVSARYAVEAAYYCWGIRSWQYGRAMLLYSYANYRIDGDYNDPYQTCKGRYRARPFDRVFDTGQKFDWTKVDERVRRRLLDEHHVYVRYLYEMQDTKGQEVMRAMGDTFQFMLRL